MSYTVEFYHEGEAIETRDDHVLSFVPSVGELIYFEADNPSVVKELGCWWRVVERRLLLMSGGSEVMQTVQLACEPFGELDLIGCKEES